MPSFVIKQSRADPMYHFLKQIPKTDLHVHLEGSLRPETVMELSKDCGINELSTMKGIKSVFK